jgi:hypothetical protein
VISAIFMIHQSSLTEAYARRSTISTPSPQFRKRGPGKRVRTVARYPLLMAVPIGNYALKYWFVGASRGSADRVRLPHAALVSTLVTNVSSWHGAAEFRMSALRSLTGVKRTRYAKRRETGKE